MTVSDGSNLLITVTPLDALGNPTTLQAVPTWNSSNTSILNPTVAADGLSATGIAQATGSVTITVTPQAPDTAAPGSVAIDVVAGQAVTLQLTVTVQPTPAS